MLFTIGLILLALWVLGTAGVYQIGDLVHGFLLAGVMLLLLAFLYAREAAVRRAVGDRERA